MKSAIELYKEAYETDYIKGDVEEAEYLYKQIIAKYPHSDEKEYAEVHLERIRALASRGEDGEALKLYRTSSSGASGLGVVAFVISLLIIAAGIYFYFVSTEQELKIKCQTLLVQGLHSLHNGNTKAAEVAFQKAQMKFPKEELSYQLMIDTYLKENRIKRAETELTKWKIAAPFSHAISSFERKIQRAKAQE